jgi:hypothetical protein
MNDFEGDVVGGVEAEGEVEFFKAPTFSEGERPVNALRAPTDGVEVDIGDRNANNEKAQSQDGHCDPHRHDDGVSVATQRDGQRAPTARPCYLLSRRTSTIHASCSPCNLVTVVEPRKLRILTLPRDANTHDLHSECRKALASCWAANDNR